MKAQTKSRRDADTAVVSLSVEPAPSIFDPSLSPSFDPYEAFYRDVETFAKATRDRALLTLLAQVRAACPDRPRRALPRATAYRLALHLLLQSKKILAQTEGGRT